MQTVAPTSSYGVRLERYSRQRDEWIKVLQMRITPSIEQLMRKMYRAAEICVAYQPEKHTVESAYSKLISITKAWTDEEIKEELGEKRAEDADVCLQMAVKSHATVLALATARSCKQVITVPSIVRFFRSVLDACVSELSDPELFCKSDIDLRAKVRRWIDQVVLSQAIGIVPVGMFAKCSSATQDYYNQLPVAAKKESNNVIGNSVAATKSDVVTYSGEGGGATVLSSSSSSSPNPDLSATAEIIATQPPPPPPSPTIVAQKRIIEDAETHVNEEIHTDDEEDEEEKFEATDDKVSTDETTVPLLPKEQQDDDVTAAVAKKASESSPPIVTSNSSASSTAPLSAPSTPETASPVAAETKSPSASPSPQRGQQPTKNKETTSEDDEDV